MPLEPSEAITAKGVASVPIERARAPNYGHGGCGYQGHFNPGGELGKVVTLAPRRVIFGLVGRRAI